MTLTEVKELMRLRSWSRATLAGQLDITEAAIHKWFRQGFVPGGPVTILLRLWLDAARQDAGIVIENGKRAVGAAK